MKFANYFFGTAHPNGLRWMPRFFSAFGEGRLCSPRGGAVPPCPAEATGDDSCGSCWDRRQGHPRHPRSHPRRGLLPRAGVTSVTTGRATGRVPVRRAQLPIAPREGQSGSRWPLRRGLVALPSPRASRSPVPALGCDGRELGQCPRGWHGLVPALPVAASLVEGEDALGGLQKRSPLPCHPSPFRQAGVRECST